MRWTTARAGLRLPAALVAMAALCISCGERTASDDSGTGTTTGGGVSASCIAPYVDDQPPGTPPREPARVVAPGDSLQLYGHWYTSTCNDTGGSSAPMEPLPPVHVTLTLPGGDRQAVGAFTPGGEDMGFSFVVQVPVGTPDGVARIEDDRTPTSYSFQVGK